MRRGGGRVGGLAVVALLVAWATVQAPVAGQGGRDQPQATATPTPADAAGAGRDRPQGAQPTPDPGGRDRPQGAGTATAPPEDDPEDAPAGYDGRIAYAGSDGNIWLTTPDGRDQEPVTTTGTPDEPFGHPSWSPDGRMLAFDWRDAVSGSSEIHLWRDGEAARVPNVRGCAHPTFYPDGQRLALACGLAPYADDPVPTNDDLRNDPALGFLSTVNLDGGDWRVLTPYVVGSQGEAGWSPLWDRTPRRMMPSNISISAGGDSMLITVVGGLQVYTWIADPGSGAILGDLLKAEEDIYHDADYLPNGEGFFAARCRGACYAGTGLPTVDFDVVTLDSAGTLTEQLVVLPTNGGEAFSPSLASSGDRLAYFSYDGAAGGSGTQVYVVDLPDGEPRVLAPGSDPAWQPTTPPERPPMPTAFEVPGVPAEAAAPDPGLPGPFLGTWEGTGVQINPATEWPLSVELRSGGVGTVVGTIDYPTLACGGELTLVTAATETAQTTEAITYGGDNCVDGGTFTFSGATDDTLDFSWVEPAGDSSASGTLYRTGTGGADEPGVTITTEVTSGGETNGLPAEGEVPGGLVETDAGERAAEDITANFPDPADAAQRFADWGWQRSVYRTFGLPEGASPAPGQTTVLDVGIHRFAGAEETAEALPYFADARAVALGLGEIPLDPIGDRSSALAGWVGDLYEVTVYVQRGPWLARISASSPDGDPYADAVAVAGVFLVRADGVLGSASAGEPSFPPLSAVGPGVAWGGFAAGSRGRGAGRAA